MLINKKMFDKNILLFNQDAENRVEALTDLASVLLQHDIVNELFLNAILQREQEYPTGLGLSNGMGVAIPHTDSDKVKYNQIGFMSLKKPVIFRQMGSETDEVAVSMIFILCLKSAHNQLDLLQKLMELFGNKQFMTALSLCQNKKEFYEVLEFSSNEE